MTFEEFSKNYLDIPMALLYQQQFQTVVSMLY